MKIGKQIKEKNKEEVYITLKVMCLSSYYVFFR